MHKETRKDRRQRLRKFAEKIKHNLPKSEQWFLNKLVETSFPINIGQSNDILGFYLPDFKSKEYKFVVEVDGSIHEKEFQKIKDKKKNRYYKSTGYHLARIKAYDENSFNTEMIALCNYLLGNTYDSCIRDAVIWYKNKIDGAKLSRCEKRAEELHHLNRGESLQPRVKTILRKATR